MMGDANDSGVVVLLFPGVLFPIIFLMTLAVSKSGFRTVPTLSTKRILIASAFESVGPTLALFISGILMTATHFLIQSLVEARWYRIGLFLSSLLIINFMVNYIVFCTAGNEVSTRQPEGVGVAISLASLSTVLFLVCWVATGR
jgi:hypothetical protein